MNSKLNEIHNVCVSTSTIKKLLLVIRQTLVRSEKIQMVVTKVVKLKRRKKLEHLLIV